MRANGFTLIEILIVLLIIGIILSFAVVSFGDFGAKRTALVACEQFNEYLRLIQQQAILTNTSFGVNIDGSSCLAFPLERNDNTQTKSPIPRLHRFPANIIVNFTNKSWQTKPQIIIQPDGSMTEFKIAFGSKTKPNLTRFSTFSSSRCRA